MANVGVDWSASGGQVDANGHFIATTSGQYSVVARVKGHADIADSARVGIWRDSLEVFAVKVMPDSIIVETDEEAQLSAEAQLANGATTQSEALVWKATGGQVSNQGAFVASDEGRYAVSAVAKNGVSNSAVVVVTKAKRLITGVTVKPSAPTLAPGAPQQFYATGSLNTGGQSGVDVVWSATGGTITSTGMFVAGSRAGKYRVIARLQLGTVADTAIVTVGSLPITQLILAPGSATVAPGSSLNLTASGKRSDGSTAAVSPAWQATGGTITSNGVYTAGSTTGAFRVIASLPSGVADTAPVVIKLPVATLTAIVLNPSSASVAVAQTRDLTVTASWSDGSTTVPPVSWSATGGAVAAGGRYTAGGVPGSYRVIAAANGKADTAAVTVTAPVLTGVTVSPGTGALLPGQTLQFSVAGLLSDGTSSVPAVTWSAGSGTISPAGLYTASTTTGTFTVIAQAVAGPADTAYVTVSAPVVSMTALALNPKTASLTAGAGKAFAAQASWSNSTTSSPAVSWTATGGTITLAGFYVAGPVGGNYKVIAAVNGQADTAAVIVTAIPTLTSLRISPKTSTVNPAGQQQFAGTAQWSDGTTALPPISWSATGGTVSSSGLYTAGPGGGIYRVIATSPASGRADTATVTINAPVATPTLKGVVLTPTVPNTVVSGVVQFFAVGQYTDGSLATIPITWTAQGGSISSTGVYTAGSTVGIFPVIAASQGGTFADTSMVTVNPGTTGFPAAYNPSRLGSYLLAGNTWQSIVTAGTSDHGWANLIAAVPFGMGSSPAPTNANMLGVYPDATFGQAVRISNLPGANGMTAQSHNSFAGTKTVWARWTMRLEGSDPTVGFTAATTTPGESGTYKLGFLFPVAHRSRVEMVLMSSGQIQTGAPSNAGTVETSLVATDPTTPDPAPPGGFAGIYSSSVPSMGGQYAPTTMLKNGDWYAITMNVTMISPTEYLQRFFFQRLTVNGAWSPWSVPVWMGQRVSGATAETYNDFWMTGNKSGAATLLQHMWLGPWEVTNAPDPYGWDHYGK
ncbi:MAG: hypothetical protein ABI647_13515 [Gemmatimonadota bacterium]